MEIKSIGLIACYESRLLWRNWIFRIILVLGIAVIFVEQYFLQGYSGGHRFMMALPGTIPLVNNYLFILLQSLLVIFAVLEWRRGEKGADTLESTRVRPIGNTEYLWGKGLGIVRLLSIGQLFSLLMAMGINLFASESPFSPGNYLFYWLTLSFPALVFMTGLSILVTGWIRNTGISLLVLVAFFVGTLYYLTDWSYGVWDFTSTDIPNLFSEITDYRGISYYVLHRILFLLLGIGFLFWATGSESRLTNGRTEVRRGCLTGMVYVLLGVSIGIYYSVRHWQDQATREVYLQSALKHASSSVRVNRHDLEVKQDGNKLSGNSRLEIINRGEQPVEQWVLYLNPGLQIVSFDEISGNPVCYNREHQIILIKRPLEVGDTCVFYLKYEGKIDERVCYPEVSSSDYWHQQWINCPMRFGKRYAYVGDEYTLLTPEAIWYPVAVAPVNVSSVYATGKDFTDFRLRVFDPEHREVISQGEGSREGDTVRFDNWQRLPGLTLCMGSFERYSMMVDSVKLELYNFRGHDQLASLFKDIPAEEFQKVLKRSMGRLNLKDYPFQKFVMMETPVSFAVNTRSWKSGSEYIQPELFLFPERWYTIRWMNVKKSFRILDKSRQERAVLNIPDNHSLEEQLLNLFIKDLSSLKIPFRKTNVYILDFSKNFTVPRIVANEWSISPLFLNFSGYVFSNDYPIMNEVLSAFALGKVAIRTDFQGTDAMLEASQYLATRSLKDALQEISIPKNVFESILQLKTNYIKDYICLSMSEKEFYLFVERFKSRCVFREVAFDEFVKELKSEKGVDLEQILPNWFHGREIPAYLVKDLGMDKVITDEEEEMHRVRFKIRNIGKVDGIVSLSLGFDIRMDYFYSIPAGASMEIKKLFRGESLFYKLNVNLSSNIPHGFMQERISNLAEVRDTADGIFVIDEKLFLPPADEFIVDNEDSGFQLVEADNRQRLFEKKDWKEKTYQFDYIALRDMGQSWPTRWTACVGYAGIYGDIVRSLFYKKAGDGNSKAIWTVNVPKSGVYELCVYIDRYQERMEGDAVQSYELTTRDGVKQVSLKIDESNLGWLSLGEFDLSAGENQIILSDKGMNEEQVIYADAVKWKFIDDK